VRPALAALAAVYLAGCASDLSRDERAAVTTSPPNAPAADPDDVRFIDQMSMHHQMAVDMAQNEVDHGHDADVKAMAQQMLTRQKREIAELAEIRGAIGAPPAEPMEPPMPDAKLQAMQAMSGADLDRQFLADMIPHHEDGVRMADEALPDLTDDRLVQMAKQIQADQTKEIGEMRSKLDAMSPVGAR
jgi:uncharacterized protein (DUF305 family)